MKFLDVVDYVIAERARLEALCTVERGNDLGPQLGGVYLEDYKTICKLDRFWKSEFLKSLDVIDDTQAIAILAARHLDCKSFSDIAHELKLSRSTVFRKYSKYANSLTPSPKARNALAQFGTKKNKVEQDGTKKNTFTC